MSADRWVLVPVEPTGEMWSAGRSEFLKWARRWEEAPTADAGSVVGDVAGSDIYRAMIDAAPAAPEPHIDGWPLYSGLPPAAPAAEPVGWISVKNQMPPPNSDCLVWFEGDRVGIANTFTKWRHHSNPLGYLIQGHGGSHDSVTHWMPLPAAPGAAPAQSREPLVRIEPGSQP